MLCIIQLNRLQIFNDSIIFIAVIGFGVNSIVTFTLLWDDMKPDVFFQPKKGNEELYHFLR